jgi:DUF4097 and DUF4098 domain-containing protein YvlB
MLKKILIFIGVLGLILIAAGLILTRGDFTKVKAAFINDDDYDLIQKSGDEVITAVDVDVDDNNVTFYHSIDEGYKLEYYESKYETYSVSLVDGKLSIRSELKNHFRLFTWQFKSSKTSAMSIYLPLSFTGSINAKVTSGEVNIDHFTLTTLNVKVTSGKADIDAITVNGDMDVEINSGDMTLNDITCYDLSSEVTSGRININNSTIQNKARIRVTSGKINITESTFAQFDAKLTSGNMNINKINCSYIVTHSTSGDVYIKVVGNKDDYKAVLDIDSGKIYYAGIKISSQTVNTSGAKYLEAKGSSGKIIIEFVD